jgi:uncharacterized membrane protein
VSSVATLLIAIGFAQFFVKISKLLGLGSEGAFYLQGNAGVSLNFQGILISSIIIGMLGVLDDVTTAQSATVEELKKAQPNLGRKNLYKHAISVGKEHIASLVNTLALAYVGASLTLFLLLATNEAQPFWVVLNSEFLAEEIVRMLAGSVALILAVPISTLLAVFWFSKKAD